MNMIPLSALDRPIAFHPVFRKVSGSTVAAVFLSQAWYWTGRLTEDRDGWFYKTRAEWEEETGLSRREQETARRHLSELGILEQDRRGVPAKLWFRIDQEVLATMIQRAIKNGGTEQSRKSEPDKQERLNPTNIHTEITTEITSPSDGEVDVDHEDRFERFWSHYPRKEGKKPCKAWWLRHKPDEALTEQMIAAVVAQGRAKKWTRDRMQYIPMPSTWLNQERWNDAVDGVPSIRILAKPEKEMTELERLRWEVEDEIANARIFGYARLQFFDERKDRIRELEAQEAAG